MNLDMIAYEGFLFMQSWDAALFNMGPISKQVAVIEAINNGDGAPDPDSEAIDDLWYVGQGSSGIKHYVQCSDFGASDFAAGDFVTVHTARTSSWGVSDGVDVTDGYTAVFEVYEVDAVNNRLVFRTPVMTDYAQQFSYTSLGGQATQRLGLRLRHQGPAHPAGVHLRRARRPALRHARAGADLQPAGRR